MRKLLFMLLFVLPVCAFAQSEVAVTAGGIQSDNMGQSRSLFATEVQGRIAVDLWDFTGWVKYADSAKMETPGGFETTVGAGARHWLGPHFFAEADVSYSHVDVHVWTKDVWFAHGYTGVRLWYPSWTKRPHRDEISVGYQQEVGGQNRTHGVQFFWRHDLPLHGNWFLRGGASFALYRYRQSEQWQSGEVNMLSLGIVFRPHDE